MNASVAIQTLPEAANDEELIRIVDQVIDYIKSTGLNYYVGPFETAIEGDYDELMDIVKECQHIAVRAGAPSVAAYIKVSYKAGSGDPCASGNMADCQRDRDGFKISASVAGGCGQGICE